MRKRIKVGKYVYHVSYPEFRESITKQGLVGSSEDHFNVSNAVYANNEIDPSAYWYPMNIDFDSPWDLDFWRIDTELLKNDWFIDEVMWRDYCSREWLKHLYVYTKGGIPIECLSLYRFQKSKEYYYLGEGTAHFRVLDTFRRDNKVFNELKAA